MPLSRIKGAHAPVDVPALFDSAIPALVADLVAAGTLVGLSTTKDGGALGITVTLNGEWVREYFRETEAAVDWLGIVLAEVKFDPGPPPASAARGSGPKPRRGS